MAGRRDTEKDDLSCARESSGWIRGRNGKGWLRPISKGDRTQAGYKKPHSLTETLQAARKASPRAIATLIRHLDNPDGRVAVTAANLLLERGWGRPKEQPQEEAEQQMQLDLSMLSDQEVAILVRLVESNRWRGLPAPATEANYTEVEPLEGESVDVDLSGSG
jgi:hypothetical protein